MRVFFLDKPIEYIEKKIDVRPHYVKGPDRSHGNGENVEAK
jgi:hypothetical protein